MGLIHSRASKKRDKAEADYFRQGAATERQNRRADGAQHRADNLQQRTEAAGDNPWRQPTLGGAISAWRRRRRSSR